MSAFISELGDYVSQGGFVMWPLILLTFVLWYALGNRYLLLSKDRHKNVRSVIRGIRIGSGWRPTGIVEEAAAKVYAIRADYRGNIRRFLEHEVAPYEEKIGRYGSLVRTVVVIAPLAGLLGTVSGMIEMFDSLADQTFFSQSGGVANGISKALITTQLGLAIAIPGLIIGRLLDRKERRILGDISQLVELLSDESGESV